MFQDTRGWRLVVLLTAASAQDRAGGQHVIATAPARYPRLRHLWADREYAGQFATGVRSVYPWTVDIVGRRCIGRISRRSGAGG